MRRLDWRSMLVGFVVGSVLSGYVAYAYTKDYILSNIYSGADTALRVVVIP